ncbi:MAG TPA: hypothetical protein VFI31_28855 [Pirellulales bacterium]|nr:hypothetical protein [Pirellulales bacterium]
MERDLKINVGSLDVPHRRALEEVIGRELAANQRLIIHVAEIDVGEEQSSQPAQSLDDWTSVYAGLSEQEIEAIDKIAKTRANLTRDLP